MTFCKFAEKKQKATMGVYIMRFNTTQGMCGYKFFECAIKYMRVIGKNAVSSIIAPTGGGNLQPDNIFRQL